MGAGSDDTRRPGDTPQDLTSAHTLPSAGRPDGFSSADTVPVVTEPQQSAPRAPQVGGEVLGNRYEILGEIGRGGEGIVYRALDLKADAVVALKVLQQGDEAGGRLARFRRELQMARRVTHPNVVRIHDLIELPDRFGLSMQLVEGEPLDARIARGPLSKGEVEALALDLAQALAAAHKAGVTHRDLKPGNVLLRAGDGGAMVTDFGVSRVQGPGDSPRASRPDLDVLPVSLTREGVLVGTPQYMAPEQLEGRTDIGPPADVYAWGVLVHEAATGRRPLDATTVGELRRLRTETRAPSLGVVRPDLGLALVRAVDRALSPSPTDRFPGGAELVAALHAPATAPPPRPPPRRRRGVAPGLMLLGLAAAGVAWRLRPAPPPQPAPVAATPARAAPARLDLRLEHVRRVTFGDGCEEFPSFTPDGRTLVYDATVGPDSYVFALDLTEGAAPRALTKVRGWDMAARLSPAGDRFAFLRFTGESVGAYVAWVDGRAPPRRLTEGAARPSWSADGRGVWAAGESSQLTLFDPDTGAALRSLTLPAGASGVVTQELPCGAVLSTFGEAIGAGGGDYGGLAEASDAGLRTLFRGEVDEVLALAPGGAHALVARRGAAGDEELVAVPLDGSAPLSLSASGIVAHKGVALSKDARQIAWSKCDMTIRFVGVDPSTRVPDVIRTAEFELVGLSPVAGTSTYAAVAVRRGPPELWILDASGGAAPRRVPIEGKVPLQVGVSSDGARFVVATQGEGIWAGSLVGEVALRRLTFDEDDVSPSLRGAGDQVLYTHYVDGEPRVMTVPFAGGASRPLLEPGSDGASCSPADDRVAYLGGRPPRQLPMLWSGRTGVGAPLSRSLAPGRYWGLRFAPDGKRVAVIRGDRELLEIDARTGALLRSWTPPGSDSLYEPIYTSAGLLVRRTSWQGNLWVADATW